MREGDINGGGIADVAEGAVGAVAGGAEFVHGEVERGGVKVEDFDGCPVRGEAPGDGEPDAGSAAGDDGGLGGEIEGGHGWISETRRVADELRGGAEAEAFGAVHFLHFRGRRGHGSGGAHAGEVAEGEGSGGEVVAEVEHAVGADFAVVGAAEIFAALRAEVGIDRFENRGERIVDGDEVAGLRRLHSQRQEHAVADL